MSACGKRLGSSVVGLLVVVVFSGLARAAEEDRGKAELVLGGKKISVDYGRPSTEGKGYHSLEKGIAEGTLWRMGKNEATRLESEADLKFGDVVVKAGKYRLAAKKTKDGWDLLVHPKAEGWGTPVPKDGYVATIPLKLGEIEEEAKLLTIALAEKEGTATFTLSWGKQTLSAEFKLAE